MHFNSTEYALMFKALSDQTRLQIAVLLTKGETCACKILETFNFTQPTLSYHMKQLTDCNLVNAHKVGKWVYYCLNTDKMEQLREFFTAVSVLKATATCGC